MNEFKYQLTQLVFLLLLGFGAYWALTHLDNGISYTRENIVEDNAIVQEEPDQVANTVDNETVLSAPSVIEDNQSTENTSSEEPTIETVVSDNKNSDLISALDKLIESGVTMNNGSNGSEVGTVQKFLDFYFTDKDVSIDNDFGPTTKGLVKDFQQAELNGGDGRIGPNTLKGMVEYLKK